MTLTAAIAGFSNSVQVVSNVKDSQNNNTILSLGWGWSDERQFGQRFNDFNDTKGSVPD